MKKCFFVGPASARSNKTGVVGNNWVGWLVGWLFGYLVGWLGGWLVTQFSQKLALRIFLIFCVKLGAIKVEKSPSRIFEKNS